MSHVVEAAQPNDLRVEMRVKNNVLWHAIFDLYPSIAEFCRANGAPNRHKDVCSFLNFSMPPYRTDGVTVTSRAQWLVDVTGIGANELFPPALYAGTRAGRMRTSRAFEVSSHQWVSLAAARHVALPASQEDLVSQGELTDRIQEVLASLTPREQQVIRARFFDHEDKTVQEIADDFSLSRARVHQIEANALQKLRRQSRARKLKPFLPPEEPEAPAAAPAPEPPPPPRVLFDAGPREAAGGLRHPPAPPPSHPTAIPARIFGARGDELLVSLWQGHKWGDLVVVNRDEVIGKV